MKKEILLIFLTSFLVLNSQEIESFKLPSKLKETSGLEYLNEYFLTINDKGNDPIIYRFYKNGKIEIETRIEVKNLDWEDLAKDNNNLYVADTGNNNYSRRKLKIHILKIINSSLSIVGTIVLKIKKEHKVNIEAITVVGDELHLFNKNDKLTTVYQIPTMNGTYSLDDFKTFNIKSKISITGADYDSETDTMFLCGYSTNKASFIYSIINYSDNQKVLTYSLKNIKQVEGIKLVGDQIYFTNEKTKSGKAKLNKIPVRLVLGS